MEFATRAFAGLLVAMVVAVAVTVPALVIGHAPAAALAADCHDAHQHQR